MPEFLNGRESLPSLRVCMFFRTPAFATHIGVSFFFPRCRPFKIGDGGRYIRESRRPMIVEYMYIHGRSYIIILSDTLNTQCVPVGAVFPTSSPPGNYRITARSPARLVLRKLQFARAFVTVILLSCRVSSRIV